MKKRSKKDFNHNLMIVGIVGVVAVIGILITLGSGTYTGKVVTTDPIPNANAGQELTRFNQYNECVGQEVRSGCSATDEIKDWCKCRIYERIIDGDPTPTTEIYKGTDFKSQQIRREDCGEKPRCNAQGIFAGEIISGKVAGIESQKLSNVKTYVGTCLNRFGHVRNWDAFTRDITKGINGLPVDYSQVPKELTAWCSCEYVDVIKNTHNMDARAIVLDPMNFYGNVNSNSENYKCGPNPITGY